MSDIANKLTKLRINNMLYVVTHITRYQSQEPISLGMNRVCLTPRQTPHQKCRTCRITSSPVASLTDRKNDYFGNHIKFLSFERGYPGLEIRAESRVHVASRELPMNRESPNWESLRIKNLQAGQDDYFRLVEMSLPSPMVDGGLEDVRQYASGSFTVDRPILEGLQDLLKRFNTDFDFDSTATTVNTPVDEVFQNRRGVCQDFAHMMLAMLRSVGLPARYVSGYLRTIPPEGEERMRGADASHAWLSVYCGGDLGWVDIDPTNNCFVNEDHVTVAWGRDYSDVAPVKGVVIGAGSHSLDVSVDVEPIG